jgi:hypothetical protein
MARDTQQLAELVALVRDRDVAVFTGAGCRPTEGDSPTAPADCSVAIWTRGVAQPRCTCRRI